MNKLTLTLKPGCCGRVVSASTCQAGGLWFKSGILPLLKHACGESNRLLCWLYTLAEVSHQRWISGNIYHVYLHKVRIRQNPLRFWNPEETSPEVQNRGISGPKNGHVSNKNLKKKQQNNEVINQSAGGVIMGDSKTATIISESEWAWDRPGEEPRGLGDYRVPKDMLSDLDGNPRTRVSLAPKLGKIFQHSFFLLQLTLLFDLSIYIVLFIFNQGLASSEYNDLFNFFPPNVNSVSKNVTQIPGLTSFQFFFIFIFIHIWFDTNN